MPLDVKILLCHFSFQDAIPLCIDSSTGKSISSFHGIFPSAELCKSNNLFLVGRSTGKTLIAAAG
jgi:hypothetical protein